MSVYQIIRVLGIEACLLETSEISEFSVKQRSVLTQQHLAGQEVTIEGEEHLPSTQLPMSSITPDASNVGPRVADWCFIVRGGTAQCNGR